MSVWLFIFCKLQQISLDKFCSSRVTGNKRNTPRKFSLIINIYFIVIRKERVFG